MAYVLPKLEYAYNALEPYIDSKTMEIHYTKHHQAYIDKLNAALDKHPEIASKPLEELLKGISSVPEDIRTAVRNHGGGHLNHSLFWKIMGSNCGGEAQGELAQDITKNFGSFEEFKKKLSETSVNHFGSGWGWLVLDSSKKLVVKSLPNQDSPLMQNETPILGIDVWEHAYYILRQQRRAEYVEAIWNVINWKAVGENYSAAMK